MFYTGLCGTFDGKKQNDWQQRDGSLFDIPGLRPDPFTLSWRCVLFG